MVRQQLSQVRSQTEFKALVAKYPKADRYIKAIYEDRE